MRTLAAAFFILLFTGSVARALDLGGPGQPIEINSTGETRYDNGIATANGDVSIRFGDTEIYADSARYNSQTHEVYAQGNVRIYRGLNLYLAETATYNTDTKEIHTGSMRTSSDPYLLAGDELRVLSDGQYNIRNAVFTTEDSENPSFYFRAHTVRIYEDDRVVFQNVTFYIGDVPVFWWPYLYQSLSDSFSFTVSPAYLSSWGPSLLSQVNFPISDNITGRIRLDYRVRRGLAIGFESDIKYGKNDSSYAKFTSYFIQDQNPLLNQTSLPRGAIGTSRYRLTLEDRTEFTDDIYGIADLTKLSDPYVLQDYYQSEFRINPQPDNVVAVTKTDPIYTLTAMGRMQVNSFFDTTERLPEVVLDIKRTPLFGGPIFYEGETSVADLRRAFATGSGFESYGTYRVDSFHQFLLPQTYFGWLSIVPRVGFRATYYDATRDLGKTIFPTNTDPLIPDFILPDPTATTPLHLGGSTVRTVVNGGLEASFKISRDWEDAQDVALGLDGLRHVIQPYTDFSWVSTSGADPSSILEFDRYDPTTKLRPIDFPEFTSIDAIAGWTVWRLGVANRLETRRDDNTITWLELDTYFDVNFYNPYDRTPYSNLFNKIRFNPLPWASLTIDSQVPVFDTGGFTEVDTILALQPIANLQVNFGHRYLNNNPFFENSSLFTVGGYYRLSDNWGISIQEQYEAATGTLEQQRYAVSRDLTSWVASLGAIVRDNGSVKEYGLLLTFTLKAFPKFGFDLNFDPYRAGDN